jgi:diguanylate cyclase (GGDEF)-like protein
MRSTPGDRKGGSSSTETADGQTAKEFARLNHALQTVTAGDRTLLRAADEQALLDDMCRVIVETGGYRMAFVAYAEHDEQKTVRWVAGLGAHIENIRSFPFTWADTDAGGTVTGTAIRTGKPVVGRHLVAGAGGPAYARLYGQAIKDGYGSVSAFPLKVEGQVLGALVIGAAEPDAFNPQEVELLSQLGDDLAYGISNLRVSEQHREARATVVRLAYCDALTGLPNRTRLIELLQAAMEAATRRAGRLALLHLEVGRFREINKVLGYRAGDSLLRELARRLECAVGAEETLARVGEAEFALLVPQAGADDAIRLAQRLLATLREPVDVAGLAIDARVDIGIALYPCKASDADALIRRANAAMHQAMPTRGGYAVYAEGQEQEHTRRLALMGDLHRAISRDELRLYCQPKVDIRSGCVCGVEVLVRWQHPVYGMMPTIEFIRLAEQAGTITPLTNWVLEAAFRQSHAWEEAGLVRALAINLSAHDLYDPGLIDRIRGLFSTWAIAPELIQFELTESALMADPAAALETLMHLKRLNVKLFIDDYGTGYSSLSYLQRLPVDAIKIDASFVSAMAASADSAVIVSSTIELGHKLGMEVVAEGVETPEAWGRLATLGCDVAQGYLISEPMPAQQLQQWERGWASTSGAAQYRRMGRGRASGHLAKTASNGCSASALEARRRGLRNLITQADIQYVPTLDHGNRIAEFGDFVVGEMRLQPCEVLIARVLRRNRVDDFGPMQRGAFALAEERRLAPAGERV